VLPILLATAADCDDPKEICKEAVSIAETLIETLNEDLC